MSEEKMRDALEHIVDYWNRDQNEKAMANALWHIIETAEEALSQRGDQEPLCYANVNKHGDVTRTVKKADGWCKTPLYTAPPSREVPDGFAEAVDAAKEFYELYKRNFVSGCTPITEVRFVAALKVFDTML